ncbi:MAG: hypothetical protein MUE53_01965 [Chitinophagales bacterium]|jgi:hypothetical protein|nr:hypothetical protein [Chitinophagales bacterium]
MQIKQAKTYPQPGLWLHSNNSRTLLFRLEGLLRISKEIYPNEDIVWYHTQVKELEDILGKADYYISDYLHFQEQKNFPVKILDYWHRQAHDALHHNMNWNLDLLLEYSENLLKKLPKIISLKPKKEISKIQSFIQDEIQKTQKFLLNIQYQDIELEIHEARRKLRWFSIYFHALSGLICVQKSAAKPTKLLQTYQTPKIINSPFNQTEDLIKTDKQIIFDLDHFYALNWIIFTLGGIKDQVLLGRSLFQGYQFLHFSSNQDTLKMIKSKHLSDFHDEQSSLIEAKKVLKDYVNLGLLSSLIK